MAARCSFCARNAEIAGSIVAGPRGVGICGECASLAAEVALDTTRPEEVDRLVTSISCLATNDRRHDGLLGWIPDAAVAIRRGRVTWVGPERHLPNRYAELPRLDAGGRIVIPGFVDAGTELLGRDRIDDPEGAVGRAASVAASMVAEGVTSLDLTVGGFDEPMAETVALAAGRTVAERVAATAAVTWRVPPTMPVDEMRRVLLPAAVRLATNAVVACPGDLHEIDTRLGAVRPLRPRVVVCDDPRECADAAEGALSVSGPGHVEALEGVVSIVEPLGLLDGGSLPARKLWDGGAVLAIASRNDPGRRVLRSPALMITLLVEVGGLSIAEAMWAATRGGALALGDPERGRLRPGDIADLVVLDTDSLGDLIRPPDAGWSAAVVGGGVVVATRP
ncbi:MAG TPA: amidohydrolase family protein [Acidimicrobiia bacterium]|nr:amidohydrolase family protein [Acidimicrobiia bacterium]